MKLFFKLIILFALASLIGYVFSVYDGHISIYMAGYRYDLSLFLFVALLIVGYILFLVLTKIIFKIISIPRLLNNYRQRRISNRIDKMQFAVVSAYIDGDYKKSTQLAISMLKRTLSLEQRTLVVKIGYLTSKLANLEIEQAKIQQQITQYSLDVNQFIDFADMQINFYHKRSGLLKDNLDKVLSTNKKNVLANSIKQYITQ